MQLSDVWWKAALEVAFNALRQLWAILSSPSVFFQSLESNATGQIAPASKFAIFISIINLVMTSSRTIAVKDPSITSITILWVMLADTLYTYLFWFVSGTMLYVFAKAIKGKASYENSLAAFLYLMGFTPFFILAAGPLEPDFRKLLCNATGFEQGILISIEDVSRTPDLLVVPQLAVLLCFVWYAVVAFRSVHHFGWFRGVITGVMCLVIWQGITYFVYIPLLRRSWMCL